MKALTMLFAAALTLSGSVLAQESADESSPDLQIVAAKQLVADVLLLEQSGTKEVLNYLDDGATVQYRQRGRPGTPRLLSLRKQDVAQEWDTSSSWYQEEIQGSRLMDVRYEARDDGKVEVVAKRRNRKGDVTPVRMVVGPSESADHYVIYQLVGERHTR